MGAMNTIRRLGSLPGVRKVALHPPVRKALATALMLRYIPAAWETTTPGAFLRREYLDRGRVAAYTLRGGGSRLWLQHGRDFEALYELIHRGEYAPPEPLRARLDRPGLRVLDIGANIGVFSAWVLQRWPDARITAFEPEPGNADLYRRWASSAPQAPTFVEAAVVTSESTVHMQEGLGSGSFLTADDQGSAVRGVDAFDYLPDSDFVKIDIEGGEWAILGDPRLRDLRDLTLVMEYHRHMSPSQPPRDAAERLLRAAGFTTGFVTQNYWGHGTLWAWKD